LAGDHDDQRRAAELAEKSEVISASLCDLSGFALIAVPGRRGTGDGARQTLPRSPAIRRHDAGAKPPPEEIECGRIASATVDDRGAKRTTANRVDESNGCATDRDRPYRQASDRDPQPKCRATQRKQEADGHSADSNDATRHTGNRDGTYCDVPNRDHAFRHSWAHRRWIDPGADVNERPATERD
jgi:hypothetical protein